VIVLAVTTDILARKRLLILAGRGAEAGNATAEDALPGEPTPNVAGTRTSTTASVSSVKKI
jgi:hypothetical protein